MPRLLIVANTPSTNTLALASAVARGAEGSSIDVVRKTPLDARSSDVQQADAIIVGTTENFGAMSGLIKDFFERIYYDCLEQTQGLPFALYVRAGLDGQGTLDGVQRITSGLRWKLIQAPLLLHGQYQESFEADCEALGELVAAGTEAGIF
ncbi:MAG: NAD(P)H-dependent oxidoreductase [Pseudomonadota bacterium]